MKELRSVGGCDSGDKKERDRESDDNDRYGTVNGTPSVHQRILHFTLLAVADTPSLADTIPYRTVPYRYHTVAALIILSLYIVQLSQRILL